MATRNTSGLVFIGTYTVFLAIGGAIAWMVGLRVEAAWPGDSVLSLTVFLALFFAAIIVAAPLAFRVTPDDPSETSFAAAPLLQPSDMTRSRMAEVS